MTNNNEELLQRIEKLENELSETKKENLDFSKTFREHQHSKKDDSSRIREGNISLKNGGYFTTCGNEIGGGAVFLGINQKSEGVSINEASIVTGEGIYKYDTLYSTGEAFGESPFASVILLKQKLSSGQYSDDAFLYAFNDAYLITPTSLNISSGSTTISYNTFNFGNKNLSGYVLTLKINGIDYGFIITSNTSNSITFTPAINVSGTITHIFIYKPVYLGSTFGTFKRLLVQEGVRFGLGMTGNGQNGLLYMNSSGNLVFRNPLGTENMLGGGTLNCQVFTSSGTFTVPSGVRYFDVEVVGGGGGGGGVYASSTITGGGGGGGGYCRKFKLDLYGVSSVSVTVGSGGAAGTSSQNGGNGGQSSFGSYLIANGGGGGVSNGGAGESGGSASGGDINITGQSGTRGYSWGYGGSYWAIGGIGGGSFLGIGGLQTIGDGNGNSGIGYGAGGSGGVSINYSGNRNGGAGTQGIVIIRWIS